MAAHEIEFAEIKDEIRVVTFQQWLNCFGKIREAVLVEATGERNEGIRFSIRVASFVIDLGLHGLELEVWYFSLEVAWCGVRTVF